MHDMIRGLNAKLVPFAFVALLAPFPSSVSLAHTEEGTVIIHLTDGGFEPGYGWIVFRDF